MKNNTNLKKKVCLVGIGKHMINKIIPVLKKLEFIVEGYVSSNEKKVLKSSTHFNNLGKAILNLPKDTLFIIASPPCLHFEQIKLIASNGFDFFVEKPALLSVNQFDVIKDICNKEKTLFIESLMYLESDVVKNIIKNAKSKDDIKTISTNFIIPEIPKNTYRNESTFADSLFADMICYPLSILIELDFIINPDYLKFEIIKKNDKKLFRFKYKENETLIYFSIGEGDSYKNDFSLDLKDNLKLNCFPFYYGRSGYRTILTSKNGTTSKKDYYENNCFEKLFLHERDYWINNQSIRLNKLKKVTSSIEKLSNLFDNF